MKTALEKYRKKLESIKEAGTWKGERIITTPQRSRIDTTAAKQVVNMCANNYLGLSNHPELIAAAKASYDQYGFGLSSVRFICGTQSIHKELEGKLAEFLGMDDVILYSSCFDANGGLFDTLLGPEDAVISDELNHASIIDGVRLTAKILREGRLPEDAGQREWKLGAKVHLVDTAEKVQGTGLYPDDVYMEGMLYASAVRSAHPRAIVRAIHTGEALSLPGVAGVFTAADIPGENKVGHLVKDWDTMIPVGGMTHYLGDAICIVAAGDQETLEKAKALVPILVPLFISAFRRADELAVAMECRCYHGGEGRTKLHVLKYGRRDYTALALGVLVLAGVIAMRAFGR